MKIFDLITIPTLLFCLASLWSCKKEPAPDAAYLEAIRQVTFECKSSDLQLEEVFVSGVINQEAFCYVSGQEDYAVSVQRWLGFVTTGNSINTSGLPEDGKAWVAMSIKPPADLHLADYIVIETPKFAANVTQTQILQEALKEGEKLLHNEGEPVGSNFNVKMNIPLDKTPQGADDGYYMISLQSDGGAQNNSHFAIQEVTMEESTDFIYYQVTFAFTCDLYYQGTTTEHYGQLKDGIMKIKFSLPLEQ